MIGARKLLAALAGAGVILAGAGCGHSGGSEAGTAAGTPAAQQTMQHNIDAIRANPRMSDAQKAALISRLSLPASQQVGAREHLGGPHAKP